MKINLIATVVLLVAGMGHAVSQDTTRRDTYNYHAFWFDLGIGSSSLGGAGSMLYGNVIITRSLVITGGIQDELSEPLSFSFDFSPRAAHQEKELLSPNLLVGKIWKSASSMLIISAGLSYMTYTNKNFSDSDGFLSGSVDVQSKHTIGVPVLIRGYLIMGRTVSLGAGIHGNFNPQQSTGGIDLFLGFGRFKPRTTAPGTKGH